MARARKPTRALIIIDMINALDFPEGSRLLKQALPVAIRIARLKRRLKAAGVPTIYVNDNFTHWLNDFGELVAICSQDNVLGAPLARALPPRRTTTRSSSRSTRRSTTRRWKCCCGNWASAR
jgi:nicotinamidase-related amidase